MGEQAVLQAGQELEQMASSGESEWRSLDAILADQHHRPPTVHYRKDIRIMIYQILSIGYM